ncbi:MAG TPA: glycosyltransferase, partial [Solirubrobacteraceae bacterium]|nr:glycosyltransferase [Solirubrobacteraceae bacterium]
MTARPAADVVIPFAGRALGPVLARAAALERREGDTVTVVDNRARPEDAGVESGGGGGAAAAMVPVGVRLVAAPRVPTSYFARNAGARGGGAPWIVFLDSDVLAAADLLDRLLDPPPSEGVAVLGAEVEDEPPRPGDPPAVRYARLTGAMGQAGNLRLGFVATACCAVRREAFEAAGGFREDVRSGGDADLCFRLRAAGWEIALRDDVVVRHRSRRALVRMLAQRARHGSGAAWIAAEHPGSFPPRPLGGAAWWGARRAAAGIAAWRRGDRDAALAGLLDGPALLAFELGRRVLPN